MPTANPNMVITLITTKGISNACPTSAVAPRAATIAAIASTMGRNAAAMAPKTSVSTTSAAEMPMPSPVARSFDAASLTSASSVACPVTRTWKEPPALAVSTTA